MKEQAPNTSIGSPRRIRHQPAANTAACEGVAHWRARLGRHGSVEQAKYFLISVTTGDQWITRQMAALLAFRAEVQSAGAKGGPPPRAIVSVALQSPCRQPKIQHPSLPGWIPRVWRGLEVPS